MPDDTNNLKAQLDALLGINNQQPAAPQPVNPILRVLEALATGLSVGTSADPSQTLGGIVQRNQDIRLLEQQRLQKRLDELDLLKTRTVLDDLQQQQAEQRQIAAEKRAEQFQLKRDQRQEDAAVLQFNREMAGKERLDNLDFEQNKSILELKNRFDVEMATRNQEYSRGVQEVESKDRKLAKTADIAIGLIGSGLDVETAHSVARKFLSDEKLSVPEAKALNRAIAIARAPRSSGSGRSSSSGASEFGLSTKQAFGLLQKFAENPMVQLEDGTIVEVSALATGITGEKVGANGQRVAKYLSPQESVTYASQTVLPAIVGAFKPQQPTQQQPQSVQGVVSAQQASQFDSVVDGLRKQGKTDAEINNLLREAADKDPSIKQALQEVQIRKGLTGAKQFKPKVDPKGKLISDIPTQSRRKLE
jgi:hypothetical protein